MPKAIKKKPTRKGLDSEIDVQDRIQDIKQVFEKKQKTLVAYGLTALSAAVVIGGIALYRFSATDKARQLEYEAYRTYYTLYEKTPASGPEKAQKALELFQQAYEKKKSPRILLFMADAYVELGKFDDALKTLDDFTKRYGRDEALMPLAYQKMTAIQLKKGDKEAAKKALDSLSAAPGNLLKDVALIEKAKMLEQEDKKDEATVLYRQLTEKYPNSPYVEEVKAKLGEKNTGQN